VRSSSAAVALAVATVCIGAFMGQLDSSIVVLAFPTMHRDLHAPLASVQWVGQAYLLTLIGLLPVVGRLADLWGRKLLYTYGFVIFALGSALAAVAPSLTLVIACRVLQGVGAAMLQANSVAIILSAVPRHQRGRALGIQGGAQALGLALGPAVGGLLIGLGGWRLVFWVNVPAGVVGAIAGWYLLPRSTNLASRAPFDWGGLFTLVPSTAAVLLAVSEGSRSGWLQPLVIVLVVAAVAGIWLFIVHERRRQSPLVDVRLFAQRAFATGIASAFLSYVALFGMLTVAPFYLESARHLSPATTGSELLALSLGLGLVAPVAGRLAETIAPRRIATAAMAFAAVCLALLVFRPVSTPLLLLALAGVGGGLGAFSAANNTATTSVIPPDRVGSGSGLLNMTRGLGTAFGLALAGAVYTATSGAGGGGAGRGFSVTVAALAGVAALSATISGLQLGRSGRGAGSAAGETGPQMGTNGERSTRRWAETRKGSP
jgi:EmrB/QacA subfamily drug resistance transporter